MDHAQNHRSFAALLDHCRRWAERHGGAEGPIPTPVPGLSIVRAFTPGGLQVAIHRPLIAMLLQGRKRVATHDGSFEYCAGEAMVVSADIPTVSQITRASLAAPYYSLVLEFDPAILRELSDLAPQHQGALRTVRVEPVGGDVADAALRLVRLLDQPLALKAVGDGLLRELHYWLLMGVHGPEIRSLRAPDSHSERIGRAVDILRREYTRTIRVDELADRAGMSEAAFHRHFRTITTLSPLQFQKQLRLIEARRMMLAEGAGIAKAAYAVGYASVSQFTREYSRLFDESPGRDMRVARIGA
ncbi:helix-turn-helix domain-containing protein [Paracoccus aestuariivivens]|uniref:Helix-turn-helix domain-containing protein n=2 Tax=Paracoccus aestuariivivens TaxID=1820333 RepID=A0A6L6J8J3_9RHOB|nr:helix-turn-helix domain-containing protein [Paracoccus aestuariivivens]